MADRGVIRSRWDLDLTNYYKRLDEGLKRTQTTAEAIKKLLGDSATVSTAPTTPTSSGPRGGTSDYQQQRDAVRQLTTAFTDLQIARSKGEATQAEFLQNGRQLEAQLRRERSALEEGSQGYTLYTNALQRVTTGLAQVEGAQARATAATERQVVVQEKAAQRQAAAQGRAEQAYNLDRVRQYRDELARLNYVYERDRDRKAYISDVTQLQLRMARFRQELPATSKEVGALDRVLGTATRNLNTVQNRISGLGISQQVAIGIQNQFAASLASTGGIAGDAALGFVAMNGGLGAVSTGAAVAGAAILGVGVGTAALVQRGVPQVKSFQNSINVLATSGAEDLDKLDRTLADLQLQAGRAGRSFSRAELAAALAETVKAGVDADSALAVLRQSLKLAAAEGTSLTESTALVLKAIRQYGLEVDDAATVTDRLAQAGLLAASNTTDISTGLSRVAGTGRAAGVEMSDLIGMIVELDNKGLEAADRGSNALNSALAAIAALTPKAREQLAAWNIEVDNADGSARLAGDILGELGDKLRAAGVQYDESTGQLVGNGNALRGLADIMGTEGARAVLNLTGQWRDYAREIENSQGVSEDFADQMTIGVEPAQRRLKAALDDLGKSAATIFVPGMEAAADALATVARQMDSVTNRPLSFGNVIDSIIGADGEKRLRTVNDDIARTRESLDEVRGALADPNNRTVRGGLLGILGIGGSTQGQIDSFVRDNEALLASLENQLKALQQRRDTILEEYGLGSPSGGGGSGGGRSGGRATPPPVEPPPLPIPDVTAYYDEVAAEEQAAAERLAQQHIETARTLSESVKQMQERLVSEQIASTADPLRVISLQFQQASRQIKSDTDALLRESESAYSDGAITYEQYQARVTEIGKLGAARQVQAEKDKTTVIREEFERRQGILEEAQGRLEQTQIDGIVGTIPQLEAKFAQERSARREDFEDQLLELKGTAQERARLVQTFNATETQYARIHQQEINRATADGLTAYREQVEAANRQLLQARQEAQDRELALERDFQSARANAMQQRLGDAGRATDDSTNVRSLQREASAYNDLIGVLQSGVTTSRRAVQIARERVATAEDTAAALQAVTAAEGEQVQAQQAVTSAIQSQINRLHQLQEAQVGILDAGRSVVDLFNETQALSNRQQSASAQFQQQREVVAALDAQLQGQVKVLEQQRANEASYQKQLETVRQIAELQKQLDAAPKVKLDGSVGLTQAQRDSIAELGRDALPSYPDQARTAAESFALIETQVDSLEGALGRAQEAVTRFTDQVGSSEALNLKIKVDDAEARKALTTARRTLEEVFGPDQAGRIVNQAGEAGNNAGEKLMTTFADGITANRQKIADALRNALQPVRDLLPSSDAKRGPLSDLTWSGGKLVTTFSGGMERRFSHLAGVSERMAAIARPAVSAVAIPTSRPASYPAMAGAGAAPGNPVTVNFNGVPMTPASPFEMSASQFGREAARQARLEMRKRG